MFVALLTELLPGSGCSVALSIGPSIDGQGIVFLVEPKGLFVAWIEPVDVANVNFY